MLTKKMEYDTGKRELYRQMIMMAIATYENQKKVMAALRDSDSTYAAGTYAEDILRVSINLVEFKDVYQKSMEMDLAELKRFADQGTRRQKSAELALGEARRLAQVRVELKRQKIHLQERLGLVAAEIQKSEDSLQLYRRLDDHMLELGDITKDLIRGGVGSQELADVESKAPITLEGISMKIQELTKNPRVLREYKEYLVWVALSGRDSRNFEEYLMPICKKMAEQLVLVQVYEPIREDELIKCFEVKPLLYKLPAATLSFIKSRSEVLFLDDLSPNVLETLLVLYGGDAYPTLEEAKNGAMALESSN